MHKHMHKIIMYLFLSCSFLSSLGQLCFSCKEAPASTIFLWWFWK